MADQYNTKTVYVIMHHIEAYDTPPPMSTQGINCSRTEYVYNLREVAYDHARKFAEDRMRLLSVIGSDSLMMEMRDYRNVLLGEGFELIIREQRPGAYRQTMNVTGRELIWVEPQHMHTAL